MKIHPDRVLAQALGAQVVGEVEPVPDRLLDLGRALGIAVARDADATFRAALGHRDATRAVPDERGAVGVWEALAPDQLRFGPAGVAAAPGHERHDPVR